MKLEYTNCQLCASNHTENVVSSRFFTYVRCRKCGLVYLNPRPPQEYIDALYKGGGSDSVDIRKDPTHEEELYFFRFSQKIKQINALQPKKGRMLDIGSAWGFFLKTAKESGWNTYGVELSGTSCKYSQDRFGLKAFNGTVAEAKFPSEYFDVITLWHVLEHVPDPRAELTELRRILKKDGLLAIEVPSARVAKDDLIKGQFILDYPPFHLFYYTPATLRALLGMTGFQVVRVLGCGNTRIVSLAKSLGYSSAKKLYLVHFCYLKYVKMAIQNLMNLLNMNENIMILARRAPACVRGGGDIKISRKVP